jgi:hypothetical protein
MTERQGILQPKLNVSDDHFADADDQVDPTVAQHAQNRDAQLNAQAQNLPQQLGQAPVQQAPVQPDWVAMFAQMQFQQQQFQAQMQAQFTQMMAAMVPPQVQAHAAAPVVANQLPPVNNPPPQAADGAPRVPLPPVAAYDVIGEKFYTGAVDDEGTNPVALAIDREVLDRRSIKHAEPGAGMMEIKYAIEGYTNLDPIKCYDMNLGPRHFDIWKDAWCDQAAKAARGHHPSQIKHRCWLELKKSLSPNTLNWIQNSPELHGHRDDPDFIVKKLQEHSRGMANVANMLFRAAQAKYNQGEDRKETFNEILSVTRYFEKACRGDVLDGVAKWLLLIKFGHVKRLNARMYKSGTSSHHTSCSS